MSVDIHSEEGQIIRQLIPLSTIPINQFESICKDITVEEAESGTFLFQKKDTANDLIYLIAGSITLQSNELKIETISSGTESSRFALAHQIPRKIDAFAITSKSDDPDWIIEVGNSPFFGYFYMHRHQAQRRKCIIHAFNRFQQPVGKSIALNRDSYRSKRKNVSIIEVCLRIWDIHVVKSKLRISTGPQ